MHVVITGASRGIGLEFVRQYLQRGASVYAGARSSKHAKPLSALLPPSAGRLHIATCDVTIDASVEAFAARSPSTIDLLINNAGVRTRRDELSDLDLEDAVQTYRINALGPLRTTRALLPRLLRAHAAKVVNISSGLGSIHDNTSGGSYGYRMSKAALNMATRSMSCDLARRGVVVAALSPGWVQTDMGGASAPTTAASSISGMIAVIDRLSLQDSGAFFDFQGAQLAW